MKQYTDDSQNPWAGLASYEDPATAERQLKFCGRDDDSYDVAKLIMSNIIVTLYGKSGIGKTSLINAGVFPELREEQYTPIRLRLGMRDDKNPKSYQSIIVEAVESLVHHIEVINVIDEQDNEQAIDFLWNYFARHHFYDKKDEPTTPVIVFDQFEEIFRYDRKETEILLRQLDYINDKDHTLDNCIIDGQSYRYEQNYRFVISIREDDLYRLEDSLDNCYLPALKRCRYRLHSLSEQGARDAILIPGEGLFKTSEQNAIAAAIIDKSRNENGSISTNIVSLLCSRIYVEFKRSDTNYITPALVDSFLKGNPFEQFYEEATRGFSNREKSYIEEHLVDSKGHRNSIPESDFLAHVKNGAKIIEGKNRILQRTSTSYDGKNYRIELIHDSFCEPLAELKEKRERRRRLRWLANIVAIALLCIGVTIHITNMAIKNTELTGENATLVDSLFTANQELKRGQDSLHLKNEEQIQLYKDLQKQKDITDNTYNQQERLYKQLYETTENMRTTQSRFLAREASTLVDEGDSYTARLLALEALPPNRPYTVEAEIALRKAFQENTTILKGHTDKVIYATYSPDGKRIASASFDNTIRIWDAQTGKTLQTLEGHNNYVFSVAFSPDSKWIVSASADKTARVWDVQTGKNIHTLEGHKSPVNSAVFSPDGKMIASASWDKSIRIWDTQTGKRLKTLQGQKGSNYSAAFSPDGKRIISASDDENIHVWDVETGLHMQTLQGHTNTVTSASFSPDGKWIASASWDNTIRVWDAETKQLLHMLEGHTDKVYSAAFSPDGKWIVSASSDKTTRIWDAQTGQLLKTLKGHSDGISSASFSPDGEHIVTTSWDKTARIWETQNKQFIQTIGGHLNTVNSTSFSPDGKWIISASEDNTIRIWDVQTKQLKQTLYGHLGSVKSAFFNPSGKQIVSTSDDNTVRIWDAQTGKLMQTLIGHKNTVNSALFSPDGKQIVSASDDETIRIWDAQTGTLLKTLGGHGDFVTSCSFSPNGQLIISAAGDNSIRIWDAQTGQLLQTLEGGSSYASFSFDGKRIISAASDNTVRIWDVQTGILLRKQEGHKPISFSPDGRCVISASNDETLRIWDAETGLQLQTLKEHTRIRSVTFSPTGKQIVYALENLDIRIWDFPPLQQLIDETRERFKNRQLTPEERRKYYLE